MENLKFFIGSSSEQKKNAEKVACWLEEGGCIPVLWTDPGVFPLGKYTLDSLLKISGEVDGAVFIFGEDDKTWYRKNMHLSVRDNVLFEYGIFLGKLNSDSVIFLCDGEPKLATDLDGVTYTNLKKPHNAKMDFDSWLAGVKQKLSMQAAVVPPEDEAFQVMNLFDAFNRILSQQRSFQKLQIFAISTYRTSQILRGVSDLKVAEAEVLLRRYVPGDLYYDSHMENLIAMASASWKKMEENGNIKELNLKYFDYHPDEGFYIYDDRYLITGNLNFYKKTKKTEFDSDVLLVTDKTEMGKQWIHAYKKRFACLYENQVL